MSLALTKSVRIHSNFTRSVHIERDAPIWLGSFSDYVFTPLARQVIARIADGLRSPKGSRAWTLTGPYGSGKSAFALALVQILGTRDTERPLFHSLAKDDPVLAAKLVSIRQDGRYLLPVLVNGQRTNLSGALLNALIRTLNDGSITSNSITSKREIIERARLVNPTDVRSVVGLFEETARVSGGILLIIDEMGKFLEHAAQYPDKTDVFILQLLAEAASRSFDHPLVIIGILHQAFYSYGTFLSQDQRNELAKIQGRFEDIAFQQPTEQILRLIGAAIEFREDAPGFKAYSAKAKEFARRAVELHLVPMLNTEDKTEELLVSCAPLHPLTAIILGPLFKRLAQNERSIFTFLGSHEPWGFQDFLGNTTVDQVSFYTLDRLYDYIYNTCGSWLYLDPVNGRRWAQIETTLQRMRDVEPIDIAVAKIIGLMSAIGELGEIRPSADVLSFALDQPRELIDICLEKLSHQSIIVYRSFVRSYRLWEGSDINIEERLTKAKAEINYRQPLDDLLSCQLKPKAVIARRHSYMRGTLRFFHVEFVSPQRLLPVISMFRESPPNQADGLIIYVLVDSEVQASEVAVQATTVPDIIALDNVLIIPIYISPSIRQMVVELQALRWVEQNTPELREDPVARRELESRLNEIEKILNTQIQDGLNPIEGELTVYCSGQTYSVGGQRNLNILLSQICDQLYASSPPIKNELVNRQNLSSAAAAARHVLIQRMIDCSDKPRLGITSHPPELSMYWSLLAPETTGLHRQIDGKWGFFPPEPNSPLAPIWSIWDEFLSATVAMRKPLTELWNKLKAPPVGLRDGVIPVFLCAMLLERSLDLALYENGSFIPVFTSAVAERLIKSPDKFEIRYCPVEGLRKDVFDALQTAGLINSERAQVLAVVRPFYQFIAKLPEYALKTQSITQEAKAVREVLLTAREPDQLLFDQLPKAVGLHPFLPDSETDFNKAKEFAERLKSVIRELNLAYPSLLDELTHSLSSTLEVSADLDKARKELKVRIDRVEGLSSDLNMNAFIARLAYDNNSDRQWLESLATFLTARPPQTWDDNSRVQFKNELIRYGLRFKNLEDLALAMGTISTADKSVLAVRVGLTVAGDREYSEVVLIPKEQHAEVINTANRLLTFIKQEIQKETQLAAAVEMLKRLLVESEEFQIQ